MEPSTPTDESLAKRAQGGESAAFGELVTRYEAKLMRYAKRFLLDPEDAQDIVQDVFVKAYENLQSFDVSRRFSPWIYRIAHNEFVNDLVKKKARRTFFTIDFDTLFPQLQAVERSDSAALDRDVHNTLEKHLAQVDPKYREPLILYYLEEMDYQEIADVLHIPVSTVGVRLLRGRTLLQKLAQNHPLHE